MSYTIKITKTERVRLTTGKEWKVVGQRTNDHGDVVDEYGYTPEIEREVQQQGPVLEQTVEDLNLAAVIKAINGL